MLRSSRVEASRVHIVGATCADTHTGETRSSRTAQMLLRHCEAERIAASLTLFHIDISTQGKRDPRDAHHLMSAALVI
jgi:hypothetical protein